MVVFRTEILWRIKNFYGRPRSTTSDHGQPEVNRKLILTISVGYQFDRNFTENSNFLWSTPVDHFRPWSTGSN